MKILAIETSCDETAVAVLECQGTTESATFTILGNALFSQAALHAPYGGVYPTLAKREHQKNLPLLFDRALAEAGNPRLDLVAVTQGPGLEPALWQGIEFAKAKATELDVPVVGVDHMEGHVVSGLVYPTSDVGYGLDSPAFPVLALLISGGHTELVLMKEWFAYTLVGRTKDDAVGEAFDKVARLIGLEYPGGPKVEAHAAASKSRGSPHNIVFPRPLSHEPTCDFSFSGLKTAVLYKLRSMGELSLDDREHIAEAFQDAARDVLVMKTRRALTETGAKTLVVGGGVSASREIRRALTALIEEEFPSVVLAYPPGTLHLDNAIMIGMAAYLRESAHQSARAEISARGSQSITDL